MVEYIVEINICFKEILWAEAEIESDKKSCIAINSLCFVSFVKEQIIGDYIIMPPLMKYHISNHCMISAYKMQSFRKLWRGKAVLNVKRVRLNFPSKNCFSLGPMKRSNLSTEQSM